MKSITGESAVPYPYATWIKSYFLADHHKVSSLCQPFLLCLPNDRSLLAAQSCHRLSGVANCARQGQLLCLGLSLLELCSSLLSIHPPSALRKRREQMPDGLEVARSCMVVQTVQACSLLLLMLTCVSWH